MKKVLVTVIAGVFMLGFCMTGMAQEAMEESVQVETEEQVGESVAVEQIEEVLEVEVEEEMEAAVSDEIVPDEIESEVSNETVPVEVDAVEEVSDLTGEAIEESMDAETDEDALYTYGNVVSAGEGLISVLEYDFENDQDIEIGYSTNEATVFQNLSGLDEVQAGDEVEIMYEEADGQRVAKMVSKTSKNIDQ